MDEDRDCQNAFHEVLIAESQSKKVFKTVKGKVLKTLNETY